MRSDRAESKNLAAAKTALAAELKAKLLNWYQAMPITKSGV